MIPVIIFYAHAIFATYAFCKSYQSDGLVQAFLNVAFIVILFTVGWTVSDLFMGIIISENGYSIALPQNNILLMMLKLTGFFIPGGGGYGTIVPKDSLSLILLTIIEVLFYNFYFKKTKVIQESKA
ncbi:MAG: hypothetical protein ISS16_00315 [Ignavibacteria bacterium]|nr:hypothetical protein [Ignavibacteria bacterium]